MDDVFVGVTMGPTSFYDEGIDFVLDLLQEKAAVNAVACYTYQRMTPGCRPPGAIADHGRPIDRARDDDKLTWVEVNEEYYGGTFLRHQTNLPEEKYYEKDILADLEGPATSRGVRVYARILEGWRYPRRPNFLKVHETDALGRVTGRPCYNHPDYVNFWLGSTEDLFRTYPYLAGIYWGSENNGPLGVTLYGGMPSCFCEHCRRKTRDRGVDPERAREGYLGLRELVQTLRAGERPPDGALVSILRLLLDYPEILAWERQWVDSYNGLARRLAGALKAMDPRYELGYHADHGITGLNLFKRVGFDHAELAQFYDWIKPCVYHTCIGPRLSGNLESLHRALLADLSKSQALDLVYAVNGYDPADEPNVQQLASKDLETARMSEDYTYREVDRAVRRVDGACRIYAGVSSGIPVWGKPAPEDPEITYTNCMQALEAGADGILLSREYDEVENQNLEAVGRAVREWQE